MAGLLRAILGSLRAIWRPLSLWFVAHGVSVGAAVAIRAAVLVAWGIFLAVVMTGLNGMALQSVFNANPFGGVGGDAMALVCAAFPVHFMLGLCSAYIVWKLSVALAAEVMSRTVKFLFGA
jgi:hypothetical protein